MPYKNKKDKREYMRKWCSANRKKLKEYKAEYYVNNRGDILEKSKIYYTDNREDILGQKAEYHTRIKVEKPWVAHYRTAKQRCTNPNNISYKWYGERGIEFKLTIEEVRNLYIRDNANDMKQPSIDRIYGDGNYSFGNCRFIELSENSRLGVTGRHARERLEV